MSEHGGYPSAQTGEDLHRRLCGGEPTASWDLCEAYLEPLRVELGRAYSRVGGDVVETAAHDALLSLIKNPGQFDPGRSSLDRYLYMSACCDLKNLLRGESRHQKKREQISVDKALERGNTSGGDGALEVERGEEVRRLLARVEEASEGWTEQEKEFLRAMRDGRARTGELAGILGVEGLPFEEQQRRVRRVRARIVARLKRRLREG